MRKLYGPSLRKEAGLTKTIKKMAIKNAKLLEATPASRYTPDLRHFAEEFRGTVEKVYEETTDVIEDLLIRCRSHPIRYDLHP
jgi:phosphatidylethanolamine N-methyltransferase